jgi:hypothetical protein
MAEDRSFLHKLLIHEDIINGRQTLAPLAWVCFFIAGLFVLGACAGVYGLSTGVLANPVDAVLAMVNPPTPVTIPSATPVRPTTTATRSAATPTATLPAKTTPTRPSGASTTITATSPITWSVFAIQTESGVLYDSSLGIKQWVVRDFTAWYKFLNDHLDDPKTVTAQLKQYTSGSYYTTMATLLARTDNDAFVGPALTALPTLPSPNDKPSVIQFSADGRQARVAFTSAPGTFRLYSLGQKTIVTVTNQPSYLWTVLCQYDPVSKRWKVDQAFPAVKQRDS